MARPTANAKSRRARADMEASLKLVQTHIPFARRFAARKVCAADVDDVIQDSLLRVMNADCGAEILHPKSYFITIVKTVIIDQVRRETARHRRDHQQLMEVHHPVDPLCPSRTLAGKQSLAKVIARLDTLPARSREIILAIRLAGQSFKAVAEQHDVSLSTVEKDVARTLSKLSQALDDE